MGSRDDRFSTFLNPGLTYQTTDSTGQWHQQSSCLYGSSALPQGNTYGNNDGIGRTYVANGSPDCSRTYVASGSPDCSRTYVASGSPDCSRTYVASESPDCSRTDVASGSPGGTNMPYVASGSPAGTNMPYVASGSPGSTNRSCVFSGNPDITNRPAEASGDSYSMFQQSPALLGFGAGPQSHFPVNTNNTVSAGFDGYPCQQNPMHPSNYSNNYQSCTYNSSNYSEMNYAWNGYSASTGFSNSCTGNVMGTSENGVNFNHTTPPDNAFNSYGDPSIPQSATSTFPHLASAEKRSELTSNAPACMYARKQTGSSAIRNLRNMSTESNGNSPSGAGTPEGHPCNIKSEEYYSESQFQYMPPAFSRVHTDPEYRASTLQSQFGNSNSGNNGPIQNLISRLATGLQVSANVRRNIEGASDMSSQTTKGRGKGAKKGCTQTRKPVRRQPSPDSTSVAVSPGEPGTSKNDVHKASTSRDNALNCAVSSTTKKPSQQEDTTIDKQEDKSKENKPKTSKRKLESVKVHFDIAEIDGSPVFEPSWIWDDLFPPPICFSCYEVCEDKEEYATLVIRSLRNNPQFQFLCTADYSECGSSSAEPVQYKGKGKGPMNSKGKSKAKNSSKKLDTLEEENCVTSGSDLAGNGKCERSKSNDKNCQCQEKNIDGSYKCFGCQKPVYDRYILHVKDHGYWHAECLKCSNCNDNLSGQKTCYVKNEQVFCRTDYNSLFGMSCVKCSLQFKKKEDWMRIAGENRYHIACFLCKICKRQLGNNEKYHLVNGTDIYCTNHYRDMVNGENADGQQPPKKAKRNRTSYTETQIKFLQERFLRDSNPDGNELEKIATHIQLKKRVVQVWFQNNRARLKKSANNNKGGNQENKNPSTSSGVGGPTSLHDAMAIDWDNSLEQSSLDEHTYPNPASPPMRSSANQFMDTPFSMTTALATPLLCMPPAGNSASAMGQGPSPMGSGSGASNCGTPHDQVSPHFADLANPGIPEPRTRWCRGSWWGRRFRRRARYRRQ